MKKYGLILMVTLLLIVSAVFNFNLNRKLEESTSQAETLSSELEEKNRDNAALIENTSSLVKELKETEDELEDLQIEFLDNEDMLTQIDNRLNADGNIVEKIDELLAENSQWREELNVMTSKIDALEAETSEENETQVVQTAPTDTSWKQWVREIQGIINFVDDRIVELEEAVSMLPVISLERIMIQQEIDFLNTTHKDLETLQKGITDKKQ